MKGEKETFQTYQADTDEYSDQMQSPFRLLHISKVGWENNIYSGYAILVKKDNGSQVLVKLTGNRREKSELIGMLNSLEKLVRVEHSLATEKGFTYKDQMTREQIEDYEAESERIRKSFSEIGIELP